jgi:TctA family transporter
MPFVFFIAWFAIAVAQISAGMEGMHLYFGVGAIVSVILFLLTYVVPVVGSLLTAAAVYYGARYGWHWEWWQALALAMPGIVLWLGALAMGGLASVFDRRG